MALLLNIGCERKLLLLFSALSNQNFRFSRLIDVGVMKMKRYRLSVLIKRGDLYRHISIRFRRDTVTGEYSISLSGFDCMLMLCLEKVIPELINLANPHERFPRQLPCDILAGKDFSRR